MLIGIIIVFLVCHTGEIFLSLYEMYDLLDGQRSGESLPWLHLYRARLKDGPQVA